MSEHEPTSTGSRPDRVAATWQLADLVDFEYLLERDLEEDPARMESRDQAIFQDLASRPGVDGVRLANRRWLFRNWLEVRRRAEPLPAVWPGLLTRSTWRTFQTFLAIIGLVLGAVAAANLLRYDGLQPVNVAAFLGWLVLSQLLLVLLAFMVFFLRQLGLVSSELSWITGALRTAWTGLTLRAHRHLLERIPGEKRQQLRAFFGKLASRQSLYGSVAMWPMAGALQRLGVCFNVGALVATLALVVFSDRAFGWQSAANVSSRQISALVDTLATPWSWIEQAPPPPSLSQIRGSRIILKDGIKQLATEDLVSWWPFLCLALLTYGLLPRLFLWMVAAVMSARALRLLNFNQVDADRLYERLTRPAFATAGLGHEEQPAHAGEENGIGVDAEGVSVVMTSDPAVALAGSDLIDSLDRESLMTLLKHRFRLEVRDLLAWPAEGPAREDLLNSLAQRPWNGSVPRLVWIEEAWQPPIAETLNTYRTACRTLGTDARVMVALIGRPEGDNPLTTVSDSDWRVWQRQVGGMGENAIRLERLVSHG